METSTDAHTHNTLSRTLEMSHGPHTHTHTQGWKSLKKIEDRLEMPGVITAFQEAAFAAS